MSKNQADNVTMSEGGLYSLATKGAKDVIDIATPRVLTAVSSLDIQDNRFTMADMGCADAGTSLDMVRSVLDHLEQARPGIQGTVIYADQPANDFNALMQIVHGRSQFNAWIDRHPGFFPLASGSSFYLQCVPDNTLDFAFSATAMHWLAGLPGNISGHVHMVGATGRELETFSAQARRDWETILKARARELKPGGKMVLVNFCRDEQGRYLGNTGGINMFDTFNEIWQEFVAAGRITEKEYLNMTLPQYYHSVEQFSAPLLDSSSECHQAGLRLESIETAIVPCPFAEEFREHGNAGKFADGLIPTVRSWNQSIFRAGLDASRSEQEKSEIIEEYYGAYHARVVADPRGHGMDYVHAYMTISRTLG